MTKSRAVENKRLGLVELYAGIGCVARGSERTGRFETLLPTDVDRNARDHYKGIRTDPLQGVHPDLIRVVERAGP